MSDPTQKSEADQRKIDGCIDVCEYTLDVLLERVTQENLHQETAWDEAYEKEVLPGAAKDLRAHPMK